MLIQYSTLGGRIYCKNFRVVPATDLRPCLEAVGYYFTLRPSGSLASASIAKGS